MGIQYLSSEARGFLYNLFNEASLPFRNAEVDNKDKPAMAYLAIAFGGAAYAARKGDAAMVDEAVADLQENLRKLSSPKVTELLEEVRLRQDLMYRHASPQLKADLGTYSSGIF